MTNCKHDWHFKDDMAEGLRCARCGAETGPQSIDPSSIYTIHGPTAPPNIHFYGGEDRTEILRLSKDGIWANPDVPTDEAAKKVLEAIDGYVKLMVEKAVTAAINEEIEACAAIAHEAEPFQSADLIRARKRP